MFITNAVSQLFCICNSCMQTYICRCTYMHARAHTHTHTPIQTYLSPIFYFTSLFLRVLGLNCESYISPCLSNPCDPSCTCLDLSVGRYTCQCPPTTTRSPVTLSCETTSCFNGGQCVKTDSGYVCQCIPPFTGKI